MVYRLVLKKSANHDSLGNPMWELWKEYNDGTDFRVIMESSDYFRKLAEGLKGAGF